VLGCLRQNPTTAHIPVVVCTVLADARLALSLGAAAFVRKPITQEAFLSALDQAAGAMQSGCG
jgi:CheY-like chemotaxis protein